MNQAFKDCIEKKRIFEFPGTRKLVSKELSIAFDDLNEAKDRFKNSKINTPLSMLTTPLFIQHLPYFILRVIEKEVTIAYM